MNTFHHLRGDSSFRWPTASFAGRLSNRERELLLRLGERTRFRSGQYLLRQGDRSRDVVLLVSGRTEVLIQGPGERLYRVGQRSAGDLVGELAFIDNRVRSASVVALSSGSALFIPAAVFDRFLEQNLIAYRALTRILADRLRDADVRRLELAYDVLTRVAKALQRRAAGPEPGGPVPAGEATAVYITQRELAHQVDASPVSVHRALRKLARLGAIHTEHRAIVIRDRRRLAEVAAGPYRECIT